MSRSDIAISVRDVSKSFTISHGEENHTTLAEKCMARLRNPLHRPSTETFKALSDVSFDIKKGDVVGIIGRNGAGKSTLLKILSRITEPTSGEIHLYGRVGSLLEVGTGFHPELTGRENIFLNGAILGMTKAEIKKQFDAIVDFSEIEKFLDTPVKRYSSGMYVRLAFAVAAHLNPEILIVDEVLSVGDSEFQKKCVGKMEDVGAQGRTVIFVSHSMPLVHRLCRRAVLLDRGRVKQSGDATAIADIYLRGENGYSSERIWTETNACPGNDIARLRAVRLLNERGELTSQFDVREPVFVSVEYECLHALHCPIAAIHLVNESGTTLFASADFTVNKRIRSESSDELRTVICKIPGNFLAEGHFSVLAALVNYNPNIVHACVRDVVSFLMTDSSSGDGVRGEAANEWPGVLRPMLHWCDLGDSPTLGLMANQQTLSISGL